MVVNSPYKNFKDNANFLIRLMETHFFVINRGVATFFQISLGSKLALRNYEVNRTSFKFEDKIENGPFF